MHHPPCPYSNLVLLRYRCCSEKTLTRIATCASWSSYKRDVASLELLETKNKRNSFLNRVDADTDFFVHVLQSSHFLRCAVSRHERWSKIYISFSGIGAPVGVPYSERLHESRPEYFVQGSNDVYLIHFADIVQYVVLAEQAQFALLFHPSN